MIYILLIVGFILLTFSANFLVDGASGLAKRLHVSDLVIGLTIVAFGTSAPELVVNLIASINNTSQIALTNVIGSNTINTLLILGVAAIIYPVACQKSTLRYEIPFSFLGAVLVMFMGSHLLRGTRTGFTGITRTDGLILLMLFLLFIVYTVRINHKNRKQNTDTSFHPMRIWVAILSIVGGLLGLVLGGHLIVTNAVVIAKNWGISEAIIGVTIVSLGTSLPELATSAIAAFKRNTDLAIGNVIGSNIFNIFFVLSLSSIIRPLPGYPNLVIDCAVAAASSLLLIVFLLFSKKKTIGRVHGIVMLLCYALYVMWLLK